jgi:hypothetical protein
MLLTLLFEEGKGSPTRLDRICSLSATLVSQKPEDEIADAPGSSDLFFLTIPLVLKPEDEEVAKPRIGSPPFSSRSPLVLVGSTAGWFSSASTQTMLFFEMSATFPEDTDDGLAGRDDVPVEEAPVAWSAFDLIKSMPSI